MPITKQTVAIIGSSNGIGRSFVNALCRDNYRLLLIEENREEAERLSDEISSSVEGADIEFLECSHQASWEADVILILKNGIDLKDLSEKINEVSTQKIIVTLLKAERADDLEQVESYFPNSRVVGLFPAKSSTNNVHLHSRQKKALDTVRDMISASGFQPVLIEVK
ncbi:hypothetical protein DYD21_06455 [Rhodohalobacter sp. SW132]|uniref:hypothetical protein n=1 Tax=Rhodohalobacter sp. SW132 TaxID=2293433 RepID=UPI000E246B89|nr:hypothetical protein [Rhodohalobacter sp. SW132]REL38244.1 hypothetical protein DYD21_06455 [Rhodohalobacter sp. SW132]